MKVGALEETITVTGASPVVDVQTAVHTQVLNREAIDAIPTGRTIQGMGQLIVGVILSLPDTGGARAMQQTYMSTHGMTSANNTVMVDGMIVNGLQGDGAVQSYFNDAMNQEVSYQTSGIGAETSAGGVRLNMIPREGGNRFSGDFKTAYRPGEWQGDNLTRLQSSIGAEPDGRQRHRPHHRLHGRAGRADHEGQAVVLRVGPLLLGEQLHRAHGASRRQPGRRRSVHPQRAGARDMAGQPAQQVDDQDACRHSWKMPWARTRRACARPSPR